MNNLEQQIKEAAGKFSSEYKSNDAYSFLIGAKSPEAKAHHTQGLYTEEEVERLCRLAAEHAQDNHMEYPYQYFDNWFEQNKKK